MNFNLKQTFLKKLRKNIKIFNAYKTYICVQDICTGKKLFTLSGWFSLSWSLSFSSWFVKKIKFGVHSIK